MVVTVGDVAKTKRGKGEEVREEGGRAGGPGESQPFNPNLKVMPVLCILMTGFGTSAHQRYSNSSFLQLLCSSHCS